MANPEVQEKLDVIDKLSVCLYRSGIGLFAITIACYGLAIFLIQDIELMTLSTTVFEVVLAVSTALSACNIHVYSKLVRVIIGWSGWLGVILLLCHLPPFYSALPVGFMFITFSGIALKESFCFRIFGLRLVPLLLASAVLLLFIGWERWAGGGMCVAGVVMVYLAVMKWRMPLHYDIGDKANYQI